MMRMGAANRLKRWVYDLALPEGRMVGTVGHEHAKQYLVKELSELGCVPYVGDSFELPYEVEEISFCNLIAVVPGTNRRKKPILIGAHYDSVIEAPCADDNAAAVAIALEVGRQLAHAPIERDVILALFDAEEPPYFQTHGMGSIRFYEDQMKPQGVHAALVMDLVGHDVQVPIGMIPKGDRLSSLDKVGIPIPHLRNLLFITGAESHPELANLVDQTDRPSRLPTIFTPNANVGDMSDHGIFRENGVPYLFLSCGRWQHYHEPTDTPNRLNYRKMARIARYTEELMRSMADHELPPCTSPINDTVELELAGLRNTFGPFLPLALKKLGLDQLESREDLDDLASTLLSLGL